MSDTILRQVEMLRMIPRGGRITVQQLRQRLADIGYPATDRTVQRDLQELSRIFSLECDDSSKPHGWRWNKDMVACDLAGLSTAEALAFRLLEQSGGTLLPAAVRKQLQPYLGAARQHLHQEMGARPMAAWARKVRTVAPAQPLLEADTPPAVLDAIHLALMHGRCLSLRYRSKHSTERTVHPLGLVQHPPSLYLVVNYDGFDDIRLLAAHRILDAQLLEQKIRTPDGFDLDSYIAQGGMGFGEQGANISLRVRLHRDAGIHLKETRLSSDQTTTDIGPGVIEIAATVQLTRRLRWWLLGFGQDIEIMEPASLRQEIQAELETAIRRYRR